MEIERKYLIEKEQLPKNLSDYPFHRIEQGYLCTSPVVRIRRQDDEYYLTYKGKGLMNILNPKQMGLLSPKLVI